MKDLIESPSIGARELHDALVKLDKRLDERDMILFDIRDKMLLISEIKPSLDELVILWRGGRIFGSLLLAVAAIGGVIIGAIAWTREHLK